MTEVLLDPAALAVRSELPVEQLRLPTAADGGALACDLAATLARLAAAQYRCCSFGSYTIVIDHAGLRPEIRMPENATGMLAAVAGLPDAAQSREPDQP